MRHRDPSHRVTLTIHPLGCLFWLVVAVVVIKFIGGF